MTCIPLRGLRGPILLAWPEPWPDLQQHPQLACLAALHTAASAAAFALAAAHAEPADQDSVTERLDHATQGLAACIETLLVAMDRYAAELVPHTGSDRPPLRLVPALSIEPPCRNLTPEQATFVFDLLQDIANAVWESGHPDQDEPRIEPDYPTACLFDLPF